TTHILFETHKHTLYKLNSHLFQASHLKLQLLLRLLFIFSITSNNLYFINSDELLNFTKFHIFKNERPYIITKPVSF
ncbi:hypothetical protein X975_22515, partial [Stegodyphus mimosarum]